MAETNKDYEDNATLLKALANPIRLQIVRGLLLKGCRNVGCMECNLGQSQSCISQHLAKLKAAGVVQARRSGNEVFYQVTPSRVAAIVAALFGDREEAYNCDV